MWRSFCLLLLFVLATKGKHVVLKNESDLVVAKPRIVVTFLANARQVIRYNESEPEPPPRLDPFQRLAKFFFANVLRDMVQSFERPPPIPASNISESVRRCRHGEVAFCPACQSNATTRTTSTSTSTATATPTTSVGVELPRRRRHYFLSISGGTDKRTTAERDLRVVDKRAVKPKGKKIITTKTPTTATTTTDPKDDEEEDDGNEEDEEEDDEAQLPEDEYEGGGAKNGSEAIFNEGASRSPDLKYSTDKYLLTVTTPSLIVFCLMLLAMYFCLKANGFCCRLFLTDPTKKTKTKVEEAKK